MSCVGFEVYKFSEPPLLAQQFFQSPPFGCLKIFGAPPQYLHPPPVILNELSPILLIHLGFFCDHLSFLLITQVQGEVELVGFIRQGEKVGTS